MQVGTAHSFGFQGAGSLAADAALPLMVAHYSALTGTSHLLCHCHLAPCHCPSALVFNFHSAAFPGHPSTVPIGFPQMLCIECHENTYKIISGTACTKKVRALVYPPIPQLLQPCNIPGSP